MKRLFICALIVVPIAVLGLIAWPRLVAHRPAAFPTKPGSYTLGKWRYDYTVTLRGTRSECRSGCLYEGGAAITGAPGEIRETPLGRFVYFGSNDPPAGGPPYYNSGWLNTITYDRPVFGPDGQVLREVQGIYSKPDSADSGP